MFNQLSAIFLFVSLTHYTLLYKSICHWVNFEMKNISSHGNVSLPFVSCLAQPLLFTWFILLPLFLGVFVCMTSLRISMYTFEPANGGRTEQKKTTTATKGAIKEWINDRFFGLIADENFPIKIFFFFRFSTSLAAEYFLLLAIRFDAYYVNSHRRAWARPRQSHLKNGTRAYSAMISEMEFS